MTMKRYISPSIEAIELHSEDSLMILASGTLDKNEDNEETNIKDSDEIWTRRKRWSSSSPWGNE